MAIVTVDEDNRMTTPAQGTTGMNPRQLSSFMISANIVNITSNNVLTVDNSITTAVTGTLVTTGNITTSVDNPGMISAPFPIINSAQVNALKSAAANTATLQNMSTPAIVVDEAVFEFNTLQQEELKVVIPPAPDTIIVPT